LNLSIGAMAATSDGRSPAGDVVWRDPRFDHEVTMTHDERAIRELVQIWFDASMAGDLETVLGLMTDDVVFMVPGREPFGKEQFAEGAEAMKGSRMEADSEIVEIQVLGEWAYLRNRIAVTMTRPQGESPVHRSGYALTILHKGTDGQWRLHRDANLLTAENPNRTQSLFR
jgi:uncharacterized protein (TIGR02246 family)